eukprot:TRINITY_DN3446_c0_g1_i2.p1 TRINITY_DN3446_c0_g1~~TRINITY_DN3446_c0_g1_i2.p1  ORF type:complete len:302 (-),score=66.76 TRINITY_DN3446_c0_g1_i2:220-1125(-)
MQKRGVFDRCGMSVGAGIPDFRSPGGLYQTLKPELLTATKSQQREMELEPTAVVAWHMFKENQFPYLEVRRPFILGTAEQQWKATIAHFFVRLCEDKGILRRLYTQNIDGLDYQTGVPDEKIIPVHGTISKYGCENCNADYPQDQFREILKKNIKDIYGVDPNAPKESTPINCLSCDKPLVKPRTVLYSRSLPRVFFDKSDEDFPDQVDLLVVAGTSLTVGPANSLVTKVNSNTLRLIANREPVGNFLGIEYGSNTKRDVFSGGTCDQTFLELCKKLGWVEDLKKYADKMAPESRKLLEGL